MTGRKIKESTKTGKASRAKVCNAVKAVNQKTNYELQLALHAAHQREGELIRALEWFCDRVEKGEVRSNKTYVKFRELLLKTGDK